MNNNDLLDAIGRADDRFKQEVIDHMSKTNTTYKKPGAARRTLRLIPAAAAIICLLGVTVYAAVAHWGIFDFQRNSLRPFPTEAQEIVQTQGERESNDFVTCEITESVNDGRQLNLTVRIQSAQPGQYVLMSQMEDVTFPASYYGVDYDGTIGEYAEEHNMKFLTVSAMVKQLGNSGTGVESALEQHQTPEIIDYLITCDMGDVGSTSEGVLSTTVLEQGKFKTEDVIRTEIPFTFELTDASQSEHYKPANQPNTEGVEIIGANVTHTELRTYIEITTKMPQQVYNEGGTFRFSPEGEYKFASTGGYTEEVEPGIYKIHEEMVKTDLGDSFTMEFISIWSDNGKTVLDEITFERMP